MSEPPTSSRSTDRKRAAILAPSVSQPQEHGFDGISRDRVAAVAGRLNVAGANPAAIAAGFMDNLRLILFCVLAPILTCRLSAQEEALQILPLPSYQIAVVKDGDSWYFDAVRERFEKELKTLAAGRYTFELKIMSAEHDPAKVGPLLRQALADTDIELVYASGVVATEIAQRLTEGERTKPVLAGAVQFSGIGLLISPEGTSSVSNYTFITEPKRVEADLALLKRLTNAQAIHVPIDRHIFAAFDKLEEARMQLQRTLGVRLVMHPIDPTVEHALAQIPSDAKAVYVPLYPRMDSDSRKALYQQLAKRGTVTVAMLGQDEVELGAMAGLAPDDDAAVARRTALNVHQLLQGVSTANLPVYLPVQDQLIINAASAKTAGWSPTYQLALEAEFINQEVFFDGAPMILREAMSRAAQNNAEVIVALEEERISRLDTAIARSALLPQASLQGSANRTDFSDKVSPLSPDYTRSGSYGVQLRQVLFNDELLTNARAQQRSAFASSLDRQSVELDAMDAAAAAYFNVLSARALYEIEKENLRLTRNNLQLARLRVEIGSAEPSEVFRWEQDAARGRAALIQRETDRSNAVIDFNRVLGAPRESQWDFADIELADDDYYFMNDQLQTITTQADFNKFGLFLQWMAVENSPELASFDYSLGAQGEILRQKQRRFYLPEIAATMGANRVASNSEFSDTDAENQLSIGIQLSFPLFEGGRRKAEILRQQASIRQLAAQREGAVQQIEQRAMMAFNNLGAAHPNILLSREALRSAEKNYAAVRDKYSQGAASVLDLLDAQSALVGQKQQAATAVYAYLTQVHAMQRSIAWYEFDKSEGEKARFESVIKSFMAMTTPAPHSPSRLRREAEAVVESATPSPPDANRDRLRQPESIKPKATPKKKRRPFRSPFRRRR